MNIVAPGNIPPCLRPYFFSANLFALGKKDGGVRPIAVGNTLRRLVSKCAGITEKTNRKTRYGHLQLGYGCNKGAEAAAHAVRTLVSTDLPEDFVIVKIDFRNAFNSFSREKLLDTVEVKSPAIYNYSALAYATPSYLFFGSFVIMSEVGVQQGDPEGPPLFSDLIMDIIDRLSSLLNFWYLDDGNLGDRAGVALADLSKKIEAAANLGLELNSSKCELVFLGCPDDDLKASILSDFNRICPKIEVTDLKDLVILGAPIGEEARRTLLTGEKQKLDNMCDFLENVDGHHALFLLRNCLSLPKLLYFLRTACCFKEEDLLREYDKLVVSALSRCANVRLDANSQLQSLLPSSSGGLGLTSAFHLALPAFLASAIGFGRLTQTILSKFDISDDADITLAFASWSSKTGLQNAPSQPELQKSWTAPIYKMLSSELLDSLDDIGRKRFWCFQGKLPAAWLNALPFSH